MSEGDLLHSGRRLKRALRLATLPQWRARLSDEGIIYLEACRKAENRRKGGVGLGFATLLLVAGFAAGWVNSKTWRSGVSAYAESLTSQGRPLDALPFALAGVASRGALLAGQGDRANAVLANVGGVRISNALGPVEEFKVFNRGRFLITRRADSKGTLYDLKAGAEPTRLTDLADVNLANISLSDDGAFLMTRTERGVMLYDVKANGKRTDFGPLTDYYLSADGALLFTRDTDGQWTLHDLNANGKSVNLGSRPGAHLFGFGHGRILMIPTYNENEATLYELKAGGKRIDVGPWMSFRANEDASLVTVSADGKATHYNLKAGVKRTDLGEVRLEPVRADGKADAEDPRRARLRVSPADRVQLLVRSLKNSIRVSDDNAFLIIQRKNGNLALYDLNAGVKRADLGNLDIPRRFSVSANGAFLVSRTEHNKVTLDDLKAGGKTTDLGSLRSFFLSADSFLITQSEDDMARLYDLNAGDSKIDLGPVWEFRFFADEQPRLDDRPRPLSQSFLITRSEDGKGTLYFGAEGKTIDLGDVSPLKSISVSDDGVFLISQNKDGKGTLYDLKAGGKRADVGDLGVVTRFSVSANGAFLITRSVNQGATLYDLKAGGKSTDLGRHEIPSLSPDRAFLVTHNTSEGKMVLYDLKAGGSGTNLGPAWQFHLSDAFLITRRDGKGTLYDLKAGPVASDRRDAALAAAVCTASGDAIRPFPVELRGLSEGATTARAVNEADQRIHDTLKGRPWNPCDWRGILAIFPDTKTGDAWFEGPRQWLRLMFMRYFGGTDYVCEESTLGTAEEKPDDRIAADRRAARQRMCALFGQ